MLTLHLGLRGRDEHYKLTYGDLEVKETTDGKKYVQFNERDTKTRTGETSQNTRAFQSKMWSTPQNPDRYPVRLFELYLSKRPKDYCEVDSPGHYNHDVKLGSFWYKRQRLGVSRPANMMKIMASKGGLQGNKTNHSARETCVTTLTRARVPETQIIQLTGHRNIQSLNSYKQPSLRQEEEKSHILSSHHSELQPEKSSAVQNSPLHTGNITTNPEQQCQGLFQGGSFTSQCTFNINFPTSMQTLSTTDTTYNS